VIVNLSWLMVHIFTLDYQSKRQVNIHYNPQATPTRPAGAGRGRGSAARRRGRPGSIHYWSIYQINAAAAVAACCLQLMHINGAGQGWMNIDEMWQQGDVGAADTGQQQNKHRYTDIQTYIQTEREEGRERGGKTLDGGGRMDDLIASI